MSLGNEADSIRSRVNVYMSEEARSRDTIDVKRCLIDMAGGDLVAGVVLSQIVYWHLLSASGERKLWVVHDGEYWLARKREDWWEECRVTPGRLDRALEHLGYWGLVEKRVYKFRGAPTVHVRILWHRFLELWDRYKKVIEMDVKPTGGDTGTMIEEKVRGLKSKDATEEPADTRPAPIKEYTKATGNYLAPDGLQWRRIMEVVKDVKEWRRVLEDWVTSGMNVYNVARLLLAYQEGWKPNSPGKGVSEELGVSVSKDKWEGKRATDL